MSGISSNNFGAMVELVDTSVLGTDTARCEGSSPFRPTKIKTGVHSSHSKYCDHQQNVDKNVYSVVYDKSTSSTIAKMESVVYKEKNIGSGLRKNRTFHLNKECSLNCLTTTPFFNYNLNTHVCRSCRQSIGLSSRRSQVFCKLMEMFSLCPQKLKRHYYKHN